MRNLFFLLFSCSFLTCVAQSDTLADGFYKRYTDRMSVKAFTLNTSNDFELYDEANDQRISLVPNRKTSLGFSFNYDLLAFSFGFAPGFLTANKDNKNSKLITFASDFFPGRWIHHLELFYQKGMTLYPLNEPEQYLPRQKSFKIGGKSSYNFNTHFSYKAMSFENERQLKNAGSFIPSVMYYYTSIQDVKELETDTKAKFINLAVAPAYYYNWVIDEHFLVSGGLSLGLGVTQTIASQNNNTSLLTTSSVDLSIGYNTDTFYAGISSKGTLQKRPNSRNVVTDDTVRYLSFTVGYRFTAPEFVKRVNKDLKDWLEIPEDE